MKKRTGHNRKTGAARFIEAFVDKLDSFLKKQAGTRSCCAESSEKGKRCCK